MPIKAYSLARLADIRLEFFGFRNSNLILSSTKEPDGFVQLENREYPPIVIESGWAESPRNLIDDVQLWLWGTEPPVEFVIVVEHVETKVLHDERPEEKKERSFTREEKEEALSNGKPIELRGNKADNDLVGHDAISRAWAKELLELHDKGKLMKPLLGSVLSTLYIYRRKKDDDKADDSAIVHRSTMTDHGLVQQDIYCHFKAEIYPNNPEIYTKLRWSDVLGGNPPKTFTARDPKSYFDIDLKQFHKCVQNSIVDQTKFKARYRANEILIRRGVIERLPSHGEQKKGSGSNM